MLFVRVKAKNVNLSVPIPYMFLNLGISMLTSKLLQNNMNKWAQEDREKNKSSFIIPPLDKSTLKSIVDELKKHKGLVLVDIKANDGTEVKIKL